MCACVLVCLWSAKRSNRGEFVCVRLFVIICNLAQNCYCQLLPLEYTSSHIHHSMLMLNIFFFSVTFGTVVISPPPHTFPIKQPNTGLLRWPTTQGPSWATWFRWKRQNTTVIMLQPLQKGAMLDTTMGKMKLDTISIACLRLRAYLEELQCTAFNKWPWGKRSTRLPAGQLEFAQLGSQHWTQLLRPWGKVFLSSNITFHRWSTQAQDHEQLHGCWHRKHSKRVKACSLLTTMKNTPQCDEWTKMHVRTEEAIKE